MHCLSTANLAYVPEQQHMHVGLEQPQKAGHSPATQSKTLRPVVAPYTLVPDHARVPKPQRQNVVSRASLYTDSNQPKTNPTGRNTLLLCCAAACSAGAAAFLCQHSSAQQGLQLGDLGGVLGKDRISPGLVRPCDGSILHAQRLLHSGPAFQGPVISQLPGSACLPQRVQDARLLKPLLIAVTQPVLHSKERLQKGNQLLSRG